MNRIKFLVFVFVCALLQSSALNSVRIFGVKPDLFVICVVIASLNFERGFSLLVSLCCGVLKDSLGVTPFGLHTFLLPVLSVSLVAAARKIALDTVALVSVAAFFVTLAYDGLSRMIVAVLGQGISIMAYLRISFLQALYTATVFPLVFKLANKAARP